MVPEYKRMSIAPYAVEAEIHIRQLFGWDYKESQEINSKESHWEGDGSGTIYNVTTTENYVTLLFVRDIHIPHRTELNELEKKYDQLDIDSDKYFKKWFKQKSFLSVKKCIILLVIGGLILGWGEALGLGLLVTGLGVLIPILRIINKAIYKKRDQKIKKERSAVLDKVVEVRNQR